VASLQLFLLTSLFALAVPRRVVSLRRSAG